MIKLKKEPRKTPVCVRELVLESCSITNWQAKMNCSKITI